MYKMNLYKLSGRTNLQFKQIVIWSHLQLFLFNNICIIFFFYSTCSVVSHVSITLKIHLFFLLLNYFFFYILYYTQIQHCFFGHSNFIQVYNKYIHFWLPLPKKLYFAGPYIQILFYFVFVKVGVSIQWK